MSFDKERLIRILIDTKAFQYSPTPIFTLASGAKSDVYVDCRVALSYPEARQAVGELMLERITRGGAAREDAVGGLLIGAFPIAIAVSDAAYRKDGSLVRVFVVRKEPKQHGLKKLVEGAVEKGDRALIVDDVVTSGGSTIDAIRRSREFGLEVTRAIAIIDREEQDGRAKIEAEGVSFEALCTLRDLRRAAEARTANA
ncbi:MAG TPA: orotate phosphoribosyltransferase [Candidatus Eisenbacteria bacterium]|nr:orotate phosphoribosyltransferase [Candidatus Eisenbacteria bacterium]